MNEFQFVMVYLGSLALGDTYTTQFGPLGVSHMQSLQLECDMQLPTREMQRVDMKQF